METDARDKTTFTFNYGAYRFARNIQLPRAIIRPSKLEFAAKNTKALKGAKPPMTQINRYLWVERASFLRTDMFNDRR
jgi:hypothetical protein